MQATYGTIRLKYTIVRAQQRASWEIDLCREC